MSKTENIKRFGNVIELKPDKLEEYKALHADSHPGVRHLLTKYISRITLSFCTSLMMVNIFCSVILSMLGMIITMTWSN